MNAWGRHLRLGIFGASHGRGVGITLDGVPPGLALDPRRIQHELDQRRPGGPLTSQRKETDQFEFLCGVRSGLATGEPITLWIPNVDADSKPYEAQGTALRPGHADWTQWLASQGHADLRGGGQASGRMTAPLVAAGAIAQAILDPFGVQVAAHVHAIGPVSGPPGVLGVTQMQSATSSIVRTAHRDVEAEMVAAVEAARRDQDSVGGVIAFVAEGVPHSLGDPFFDSVESTLAHLLFSIPAVKGVEFGAGFQSAAMRGSAHNDPLAIRDTRVQSTTNHAGGILGGRTTGMPLWGRVAIKPTSSIAREQATVDVATMRETTLRVTGRHDPCIAIRAAPVVAACVRLALADLVLGRDANMIQVVHRRDLERAPEGNPGGPA